MTQEEKDFVKHILNILGYDTSDEAPSIHEQFMDKHNLNDLPKVKKILFKDLPIEEKRRIRREYRKNYIEKKIGRNRK